MTLLALTGTNTSGAGFFILFSCFVGVILAAPLATTGVLLAWLAPGFVLRRRKVLCLALPVLVALTGTLLSAVSGARTITDAVFPMIATVDAVIASAWCWHRTRALAAAHDTKALTAVFR